MTWTCKSPARADIAETPDGIIVRTLSTERRKSLKALRLFFIGWAIMIALASVALTLLTGQNLLIHGITGSAACAMLTIIITAMLARMPNNPSFILNRSTNQASVVTSSGSESFPLDHVRLVRIRFLHPGAAFGLCDAGIALSADKYLGLVAVGRSEEMDALAPQLAARLSLQKPSEELEIKSNFGGVSLRHEESVLI